jgi:A/G-specific adenine glycosylase
MVLNKFNARYDSEHRVYWTSQKPSGLPDALHCLKGFFVRYGRKHLRDFPWRHPGTKPFHLLLAELLLAQTKAEDVAKVWPQLVSRYATPTSLAEAQPDSLISLLRPLGLHRQRARALINLGRAICDVDAGELPRSVHRLLALPHVGLYAATATASFAFHERVPIVDANVVRVFDRITGSKGKRELRRRGDVWRLAWAILPRKNAHLHNYGLLDFAATVCTPRAPRCEHCRLNAACSYGRLYLSPEQSQ